MMWLLSALVGCVVVSRAAADGEVPLRCRDPRCRYTGMTFTEYQYEVDGNLLTVIYGKTNGYIRIGCYGHKAIDSGAMPRADTELIVWDVVLSSCQLSSTSSILDKLNSLNVTMVYNGTQRISNSGMLTIDRLPSPSVLTAKHLIGLENLARLYLNFFNGGTERNFLAPLKSLNMLRIERMDLLDGELNATRLTLKELYLIYSGVKRLPEAVYSSSCLITLNVASHVAFDAVTIPPNLRSLYLESPATTVLVNSAPSLEELVITSWTEMRPQPLTSCDKLKKIHLTSPAVHTLPHRWLANCSVLDEMIVEKAWNLTTLPKRIFGSHSALKLVAFRNGVLETLNEEQFDEDEGGSMLEQLELNGNRLRTIPKRTLPLPLKKLDLSSNDLDSGALDMIVKVQYYLTNVNLGDNPRIGDVCDENGYSAIYPVRMLEILSLHNTNVSKICRDWREDMPHLEKLDLRNTNIAKLTFEDLQFKRTVSAKVLLEGAPVTLLEITSDDFEKAKRTPSSGAFVYLDDRVQFHCDCRMYWTRRVLDHAPHALDQLSKLRCMNGKFLNESMAEDMVCARQEVCAAAALPETCTCSERPDDDPARSIQILRVNCTHAALDHVPRMSPAEKRLYELVLANNQIADVSVDDLVNVTTLDLRNNSITRVDKETATRLGNIGGMLWLAGNRLECDCKAAPLLLAIHSRFQEYTDLKHITCSDGNMLEEVSIVECSPSIAAYVASLAVLFVLAVVVIAYLSSRERRFFVKAVLHRWGCFCCPDVDEDNRRYDAFVTFSHKDENIVHELMARLEPPYRLCVHHRDWIPGLRIPDQIMESVRESGRTLALVSRHFLASSWTRAEFREAHAAAMLDARPRLIVILLEDPAALVLDEQLQRYIATHTYLRWGDPWFYNKLAVALPRPHRPQSIMESALLRPSISQGCTVSKPNKPKEKLSLSQDKNITSIPLPLSTME